MAIKSMVLGIGQPCMECGGQAVFAWIDSGSTQYRTSSGSWFYFPRHFRHVINNSMSKHTKVDDRRDDADDQSMVNISDWYYDNIIPFTHRDAKDNDQAAAFANRPIHCHPNLLSAPTTAQ